MACVDMPLEPNMFGKLFHLLPIIISSQLTQKQVVFLLTLRNRLPQIEPLLTILKPIRQQLRYFL